MQNKNNKIYEDFMRPNVKPLTHWIIYKKYTVRFSRRSPNKVQGILTTPNGQCSFSYDPQQMIIHLPKSYLAPVEDQSAVSPLQDVEESGFSNNHPVAVTINEHGWEIKIESRPDE
ncbi:MAG: hypothetical protein AAF702_19640 [Chloroflexota bacterium]